MQPHKMLLGDGDPAPVVTKNPAGSSVFLLVCDHAGRRVPRLLGDMGVGKPDWDRHIAWDIGAAGLTEKLGRHLGAVSIEQVYSRLVVDCNRRPGHPTSMPPRSDGTPVPANAALSPEDRRARTDAIFAPYHDAIAAELDRRAAASMPAVFIAVHSFTPVFGGERRPMQAGVLYNRDPRLALAVAERLTARGFTVGDNAPYALSDESDYTIPHHAERRGLPYLELEVRQDLLVDEAGQTRWAGILAQILPDAARTVLDDGFQP